MCSNTIKRLLCLLICFIFWFYKFPCFASKNGENTPLLEKSRLEQSNNSRAVINGVQVQTFTFDAATNLAFEKEKLIEFVKQQGVDINNPVIKTKLQNWQTELEEYLKAIPGSTMQEYIEIVDLINELSGNIFAEGYKFLSFKYRQIDIQPLFNVGCK